MASLFEQTMIECQKMKLNESKVPDKKKPVSKKRKMIAESRSIKRNKKIIKEDVDDLEADDVSYDIIAVVDPEMDTNDYQDRIDDLNDVIDETPEGEVPLDDTYVGDEIYQCPLCGNPFFSDVDLHNGGTCPVCGDEVDSFVELGVVETTDEDGDGVVEDDEDITPDEEVEDDEDLDVDIADEELEIDDEDPENLTECDYELNESTINTLLTKFINENYKNASSMKVNKAITNGKSLKLECVINFKSGRKTNTTLVFEGFDPEKKNMVLRGKAGKEFKVESSARKKTPDFISRVKMVDNSIKFESFKYDFVTMKEGLKCQIYGSLINESTVQNKRPIRKSVKRK